MNSTIIITSQRWLFTGFFGLALAPAASQAQAQIEAPTAATASTAPAIAEAPARASAPPVSSPLDGIWKGPLKVPGGELEVIFRLVRLSSGNYFATLDVPLQKVSHLAVKVETRADTIRFVADEANSRFTGHLNAETRQLTGTWQQPGYRTPLTLSHSAAPVVAALAKNARLTPPYREEEITFGNQAVADLRLAGELTVPAGPGPFPAVVLLSDLGPHDRNGTTGDHGFAPMGQLADYLTRRGIAVLRFDDRSVGKSGGQPTAATADRVTDAQAALNYLRTRPEINFGRLGLIGHGEGGNVALLAAGQPLPPAFVITLAAAGLPGIDQVLQQRTLRLRAAGLTGVQLDAAIKQEQAMLEVIHLTPDNAQAQAVVANMLRQRNPNLPEATAQATAIEMVAARGLLNFNPVFKLTDVMCPVLLLHGTDDLTVDAETSLGRLYKGLAFNKKVEQKKLLGVNHLFQPNASQWPVVSGQPQPVFSPLAEETIREWIIGLTKK